MAFKLLTKSKAMEIVKHAFKYGQKEQSIEAIIFKLWENSSGDLDDKWLLIIKMIREMIGNNDENTKIIIERLKRLAGVEDAKN